MRTPNWTIGWMFFYRVQCCSLDTIPDCFLSFSRKMFMCALKRSLKSTYALKHLRIGFFTLYVYSINNESWASGTNEIYLHCLFSFESQSVTFNQFSLETRSIWTSCCLSIAVVVVSSAKRSRIIYRQKVNNLGTLETTKDPESSPVELHTAHLC